MTLVKVRGIVGAHELVRIVKGNNGKRREAVIRLRAGRKRGKEITVACRSRTHRSRVRTLGGR